MQRPRPGACLGGSRKAASEQEKGEQKDRGVKTMQWESDSSSSVLGAQSLDQQHQHRWAACSRCKFHLAWGFHPRPSESATLGRSQTSVFYEVLQMF